jgi:hypothetical protein
MLFTDLVLLEAGTAPDDTTTLPTLAILRYRVYFEFSMFNTGIAYMLLRAIFRKSSKFQGKIFLSCIIFITGNVETVYLN